MNKVHYSVVSSSIRMAMAEAVCNSDGLGFSRLQGKKETWNLNCNNYCIEHSDKTKWSSSIQYIIQRKCVVYEYEVYAQLKDCRLHDETETYTS